MKILRETIKQLGLESYTGPWLAGQLAVIESSIRSDFSPDAGGALTYHEAFKEADRITKDAKARAAAIVQEAHDIIDRAKLEVKNRQDRMTGFDRNVKTMREEIERELRTL